MADFLGLMKQAAELKSKMETMQAQLDQIEVEGTSGGGLVTVKLTGKADMKGSVKFGEHDTAGLGGFVEYCGLCGWALALAHAKSGDAAMIAGYCGSSAALDEAIGRFAMAYSKQTEKDHAALEKARRTGCIQAVANIV